MFANIRILILKIENTIAYKENIIELKILNKKINYM